MDIGSVLLGLLAVLVAMLVWKKITNTRKTRSNSGARKSFNDIPTVPGWPIVGSGLQIDRLRPDLTLLNWAKQYGPVYKVKIFNETIVLVCNYDEMHELMVSKGAVYAGRNEQYKFKAMTCGTKDVVNASSTEPHWTPMRKAAHRGIRHYGTGLTRLEETLAAMARSFVDRAKSRNGEAFDMREDIYTFVVMVRVWDTASVVF